MESSCLEIELTTAALGVEQARVHKLEDCADILDVLQKFGHNEVDSARTYCNGTSEEYLGELKWQERGIIMDTKLSPNNKAASGPNIKSYTHKPADLKPALMESLTALKTDKVRRLGTGSH